MSWLFLEPTDVFLFRNGKPFNAGENDTAQSVFPPSPLTLQGALRGAAIINSGMSWDAYDKASKEDEVIQQVGASGIGDVGKFRLAGPFIGKWLKQKDKKLMVERYVPLPSDVVWNKYEATNDHKEDKQIDLRIMQPTKEQDFQSDVKFKPLNVDEDDEYPPNRWISESVLSRYLQGKPLTTEDTIKKDALFKSDNRFGIGMDYKLGTTDREEGKLYNAEFIQMETETGLLMNVADSLIIEAAGAVGLPTQGVMGLGGERHTVNFNVVNVSEPVQANYPTIGNTLPNRFKLVFLTPAYFKYGWQPEDWSKFFDGKVICVSATISRPKLIGGWDSALGHPRTMHRFVPSGCVFYFESDGSVTLKQQAITESPEWIGDAGHIGFGQVAIGIWSYSNEE